MPKHNKNIQNILLLILCSALGLLLGECDQNESDQNGVRIVEETIAGQKLCIPYAYLKQPNDPNDTTAPIQTMYPDFKPLQKRPNQYWKEGEWWRQVNFLIMDSNNVKPFEIVVSNTIDFTGSSAIDGTEYGLEKRTRPDDAKDYKADRGDVWLEKNNDEYISVVRCGKKHTESTHPQCLHKLSVSPYYISTHFDKKLLPHWKEIKEKTLQLIDSFDCENKT